MSGQGTGREHCTGCQRWKRWCEFARGSTLCRSCVVRRAKMRDRAYYHRTKHVLRFPPEPLQALILQRIQEWGLQGVCFAVGCKTDAVRKMLQRPPDRQTVNLSTGDKWATALGSHVDLLWEEATA